MPARCAPTPRFTKPQLASNRKRLGIQGPEDAWKRLGELLEEWRRVQLSYKFRTKFAEARLPETPDGNPNVRLVTDIENSLRPNRWPAGTLKEIAAAYGVTYESVLAVLQGEAGGLILAKTAPPPAPAAPGRNSGRTPPVTGEDKNGATWPYAEAIWQRLLELAGNPDPTGAELFGEDTDEARIWDVPSLRQLCSVPERVWMIADLHHREAGSVGRG